MLTGATPAWFADNVAEIFVGVLLVATLVVVRVAQKTLLKLTLLAILAGIAVLAYLNRAPLQACARTCECSIADRDVTVPVCRADVDF